MPRFQTSNRWLRPLIRASFYPTLLINRLICAVGVWNRWDWIDDHVAVGALPSRRDLQQFAGLGISAIINLCGEYRGNAALLADLGITQLRLPTLDYHRPCADDIARGVEFIKQQVAAGHKVYIHCKAGRGRSVTVALGYLMATRQMSPDQAYQELKSIRPHIDRDIPHTPELLAFGERLNAEG